MTDTATQADHAGTPLPPGVHPNDPSVPWDGGLLHEPPPVPHDTPGNRFDRTGQPPFDTDNGQALPVFERSAHDFTARSFVISSTVQVAGRQKGRKRVTLWIPTTTQLAAALGCLFSSTEGEVDQRSGITLYPGDAVSIDTEAPVYIGVLSANATAGPVNVLIEYNPPGGSLGGE